MPVTRNPATNTSLHEACQQGKIRKVRELLDEANVQDVINTGAGVFGYSPLHEATSSRKAEIIELLLHKGADVDAKSNGDYTPLHIASSIGDLRCIETLLKYDANVTVIDEFGKTPHGTATLNRRRRAARLLKTAGNHLIFITVLMVRSIRKWPVTAKV